MKKDLIRQLDGGEQIVIHGAGIDAYFVGCDVRQLKRSVAENDLFAEIMIEDEEGIPHLAEGGQIVGRQRNIGFKAIRTMTPS